MESLKWYYSPDGSMIEGPISARDFNTLVRLGIIVGDTPILNTEWTGGWSSFHKDVGPDGFLAFLRELRSKTS